MTATDLEFKIRKILENSSIEPAKTNYLLVRNKQNYVARSDNNDEIIVEEDTSDFDFVNKQVILLRDLYNQLSEQQKEEFKNLLLEYLLPNRKYLASCTALDTLIHLGLFLDALSVIKQNYQADYDSRANYHSILLLDEIMDILKHERQIFKPNEISELDSWVDDVVKRRNELGQTIYDYSSLYENHVKVFDLLFKTINVIITKNLTNEIMSGYNPEINKDKLELEEEFKRYSFPNDLSATLNKVEQKLVNAADDFDYKDCMDLIRSFTERLYQMLALEIDSKDGKNLDEKDANRVAKFFIEHKLISQEQGDILISLRHFLSNLGVHRLKSKIEDARLSKNMTVEFSLYLMKRLIDVKSK
ncbi:MAG: hypothetical protein ABSE17_02475 [Candidatus Levyibacteriota bacterium]